MYDVKVMEVIVFDAVLVLLQGEGSHSTGKRVLHLDIATVFGFISTRPN